MGLALYPPSTTTVRALARPPHGMEVSSSFLLLSCLSVIYRSGKVLAYLPTKYSTGYKSPSQHFNTVTSCALDPDDFHCFSFNPVSMVIRQQDRSKTSGPVSVCLCTLKVFPNNSPSEMEADGGMRPAMATQDTHPHPPLILVLS